jgi:hypothetical protein
MTKERVQRLIKKNEKLLRFKKAFSTLPQYRIDFEDLHSEMKNLHRMRKLQLLRSDDPNFIKNLSGAAIHDHSFRSRLTEILVIGYEASANLNKTLNSLTDYLLSEYANDLSKLRTKEERKQFIGSILDNFYDYLRDAELLITIAKAYIDNIDKGGYTIKELVQAHQVIRKFEGMT